MYIPILLIQSRYSYLFSFSDSLLTILGVIGLGVTSPAILVALVDYVGNYRAANSFASAALKVNPLFPTTGKTFLK